MKRIAVHLADGFEEIEAVSIIDVLRRANLTVTTVSVTGQLEVAGSHNISIIADSLFEETDYSSVEIIILPGGMPGTTNLMEHTGLQKQILSFYKEGKMLGAICAAPMIFGQLGILKNKNATCYPGFEHYLEGADVSGEPTEVAGNVITGKGAGVAIRFALKIVETIKGKNFADELARKMIAG